MRPIDEEFWGARLYSWLERQLPASTRVRTAGVVLLAAIVVGFVVVLFVQPLTAEQASPESTLFIYVGLLVICFASAFFLLFPIPGLSFAAMGLVFQQSGYHEPLVVAIIACAGWSLGDAGIYVAGAVGSVSIERQAPLPGRFRRFVRNLMDKLQLLMQSTMGVVILAGVSFIPNPITGAALLAAGANRMRPLWFGIAIASGRLARGLLIAYAGSQFVNVG